MKLILEKVDLFNAQKAGFIKDVNAVNDLWDKLTQICTALPSDETKIEGEGSYELPPLKGNLQSSTFSDILVAKKISIVCSIKNGLEVARNIFDKIKETDSSVKPQLIDSVDYLDIETKVAASTALIVVLTADAFKEPQLEFAMLCAKRYFAVISQVILVHDATSCFFPDKQPPSVAEFFSEKAITFLTCYTKKGVNDILEKYNQEMVALESSFKNKQSAATALFNRIVEQSETSPDVKEIPLHQFQIGMAKVCPDLEPATLNALLEKHDVNQDKSIDVDEFCKLIVQNEEMLAKYLQYEDNTKKQEDLWTRVFLSHKRSTGQGIAGRLFEGLKNDYKIFLDSEAKFKIHNLKEIVEKTEVFVFILTSGILQSRWCREELESAVQNNKKIIVVREISFQLPNPLPIEWQDAFDKLSKQQNKELIWMAEYNDTCIEALRKEIGYSDEIIDNQRQYLESNPHIMEDSTITSLKIDHTMTWVTDEFFYKLLQNKTELEKLKIHIKNFSNDIFNELSKHTKLKTISFENFRDEKLVAFSKQAIPVQHLTMKYYYGSDVGIKALSQSSNSLKTLHINYSEKMTDDGIIALVRHNPNLERLTLSCVFSLTDVGVISFAQHKNIQHLEITSNRKITDTGIITFIQNNKQLKHLSISSCDLLSDAVIIALIEHKIPLQSLDISYCQYFTNDAITTLVQHIPLQQLNLAEVAITDTIIFELCKHNSVLQTLNIACTNITDEAVIALIQHKLPLIDLNICCTPKITEAAILQIVQSVSLQILQVQGCKVTDKILYEIERNNMPLKYINLGSTLVTNDGLFQIAKLPSLQKINIKNCLNVTSRVKTELKNIKIIK